MAFFLVEKNPRTKILQVEPRPLFGVTVILKEPLNLKEPFVPMTAPTLQKIISNENI